jgi:exosome complex component RRP4
LSGHANAEESKEGEQLIATVTGVVERVNKLISVRPLSSRYTGEVGDVVVGRIVEVADKRWKVDINGRQHSILMISSVNLPGGVQRRRTNEDSLHMRQYLTDNDLVSAEVQKIMSDRSVSLHTRSFKYGKLENGVLVQVSPSLIKRRKQHFISLQEINVDIIIGVNGFIWLSGTPTEQERADMANANEHGEEVTSKSLIKISLQTRENICRARNCILALSKMTILIYPETIMDVFNESLVLCLMPYDIINEEDLLRVTQRAMQRQME